MNDFLQQFDPSAYFEYWVIYLIIAIVLIEMILKGIALWKCGRNNQLNWFIVLFLLNTLGILPLVYLIWFQEEKNTR